MDLNKNRASQAHASAYWRANLKILAVLLAIWAFCGFFLSIVFVDRLNEIKLGGFPLGFWFAQQGSIYVFILLILVYVVLMERLDKRFRSVSRSVSRGVSPKRGD